MQTPNQTSFPSAGQPAANEIGQLATMWLALERNQIASNPEFAGALDQELRRTLPDGCLSGLLAGAEAEIRQDAAIYLFNGFLAGNPELVKATNAGDCQEIGRIIARCLRKALRICYSRKVSKLAKQQRRAMKLDPNDAADDPGSHLSGNKETSMPAASRRKMAMEALQLAQARGLIGPRNAELVSRQVQEGVSQAQMARELGVSRQSVHARLAKATRVLAAIIEEIEEPR